MEYETVSKIMQMLFAEFVKNQTYPYSIVELTNKFWLKYPELNKYYQNENVHKGGG